MTELTSTSKAPEASQRYEKGEAESAPEAASAPKPQTKRRFIRPEKIGPAFWTIASIISMVVNIILIVLLVSIGQQLFALKALVKDQVLGGLYENFVMMDQAHIRTKIPVSTQVPAKFDLPLSTNTTVTLTEDTYITNATIYELNAGSLSISRAGLNIILPAGSKLPVALNLTVPVDQKIPVELMVDVDIPLKETELHKPFVGLRKVVEPYYGMLDELPDNWSEALCGPQPSGLCARFVH
jgi:hypothetical protein